MPDNALLKATGLWRKTSKNNRDYLVGRLGGLRVLIFENADAGEGDPTHFLMLGEAEQRPAQPQRTDNGRDRAGLYADQPQQRHAQRHATQRRAQSAGEAIVGEREPGWPPSLPDGGDDLPF
jgi:hypothetical protein